MANQFIAATNSAFTLSIAPVDVNAVAKADPYFGSNIKASGSGAWIPHAAAARSSELIRGWKKLRIQ
jgi:hypothetical protein